MLNHYQGQATKQFLFAPLVPLISAVCYWVASGDSTTSHRILIAAHGPLLFAAFVYAVAVSSITGRQNHIRWIWPFWILLIFFLVTVIYTILNFDGNPWIHLVQVLVVPSSFIVFFVGTMTITHDWI